MKREFLTNLGLTEEQVNKIMDENGRDIEKYRKDVEKYSKESEKYKTQYESTKSSLDVANKTIAFAKCWTVTKRWHGYSDRPEPPGMQLVKW